MNKITIKLFALLIAVSLSSCKIADIRTSILKNGEHTDLKKGRTILQESVIAMGYDNLENYETYAVKSEFKWKPFWSMMPMNALPGNKNKEIEFQFATNSFDGRIDYLEGRKRGDYHGIQSWESYQSVNQKPLKFKKDKRRSWGLGTYHYLIEAPQRLLNAPIIKYAGTKSIYSKDYDLVFVTWGSEKANKHHDQWLLYINKETKFIDLAQLTIRDFFLPFPPNMAHGTVQFLSRIKVNDIYLPSEISVQLLKPKKKKKYVYKFKLYDYKFDNLNQKNLYPNPTIERFGDSKLMK